MKQARWVLQLMCEGCKILRNKKIKIIESSRQTYKVSSSFGNGFDYDKIMAR